MKILVIICKYMIILLGAFFIFMSIDSFDGTDTFWNMLLEFFNKFNTRICIDCHCFIALEEGTSPWHYHVYFIDWSILFFQIL